MRDRGKSTERSCPSRKPEKNVRGRIFYFPIGVFFFITVFGASSAIKILFYGGGLRNNENRSAARRIFFYNIESRACFDLSDVRPPETPRRVFIIFSAPGLLRRRCRFLRIVIRPCAYPGGR